MPIPGFHAPTVVGSDCGALLRLLRLGRRWIRPWDDSSWLPRLDQCRRPHCLNRPSLDRRCSTSLPPPASCMLSISPSATTAHAPCPQPNGRPPRPRPRLPPSPDHVSCAACSDMPRCVISIPLPRLHSFHPRHHPLSSLVITASPCPLSTLRDHFDGGSPTMDVLREKSQLTLVG